MTTVADVGQDIALGLTSGLLLVMMVLAVYYRRAARKAAGDSGAIRQTRDELARAKSDMDRHADERTAELLDSNRLLRQEVDQRAAVEASLRRTEAMSRGMFETAVDAIITIDSRGQITSFNPAAERLFGYAASEAIGNNVKMLMPQPYRNEHDAYLARYLQTNQKRIIGIGREVVGRRKDGATFPMDLAVGEQFAGEQQIFTGFVRDLTERKALEKEVLQISEREQQRIGQDLHDDLGQHLTGIAFLSKGLAGRLASRRIPEAADAERINDLVNQAVSRTRALAQGLQSLDDPAGLPAALAHLCDSVRQAFCIDCSLRAQPIAAIQDLTTATHLYRIAQEAVNNAIRHGKAKSIAISLDQTEGRLCLRVQDDGGGFGPVLGTGIGLRSMMYRARCIGATLDVRPGDSAGVVVNCYLDFPNGSTEVP